MGNSRGVDERVGVNDRTRGERAAAFQRETINNDSMEEKPAEKQENGKRWAEWIKHGSRGKGNKENKQNLDD